MKLVMVRISWGEGGVGSYLIEDCGLTFWATSKETSKSPIGSSPSWGSWKNLEVSRNSAILRAESIAKINSVYWRITGWMGTILLDVNDRHATLVLGLK